ncbi:general transcription factor II-I repeat domain-containing protein 2A [Trichonephila clavipes]|nr:general transcription factor II-I repeat domain-containing protein 2A [Trichonephila clavipes]
MEHTKSIPPKITDDEMKYFQFKARQLFLLRKEDHEWDEYCKKNSCLCSCKENVSHIVKKEVGIQSFPKKTFYNTRSKNISMVQTSGNFPQALNEIRTKLEKIDLTLSRLMEPIQKENVVDQKGNILKLPIDSDAPESVRSLINEKRMKLIQNSLKMSLQRLQSSAMSKRNPVPAMNEKKKNSGYFIPHDLEAEKRVSGREDIPARQRKGSAQTDSFPTLPGVSGRRNGRI